MYQPGLQDIIAIFGLSAVCVLWFFVQQWTDRGPDGRATFDSPDEVQPTSCGACAQSGTCATGDEGGEREVKQNLVHLEG